MSIQRVFAYSVSLKIDDGDGLFAVGLDISEVLMVLTCSPRISFFDEFVVFDGGEAALRMDVHYEVCSILFLHPQLRRRHKMGRKQ